ncbi:MAG: hypothetical protein COB62_03545 [Piscirickettsiaceae bacterium]|nr:MAG: hypothetical protein COB62_03545 [Piscirickettsiaceae bacterium]
MLLINTLSKIQAYNIKQFAQTIHNNIKLLQMPHTKNPDSPFVTVSIGISSYNSESSANFDELYNNADKALYLAKNSGRNRTCIFEDQ